MKQKKINSKHELKDFFKESFRIKFKKIISQD